MASASTQSKTRPTGKLSERQIQSLWIQAGGNPRYAPLMARIAMYESGGNPYAHNGNANTGDDSYGLWQINYFGANRDPRTKLWGPPNLMYDPMNNARAAVQLSRNNPSNMSSNWTTSYAKAVRDLYTGGVPGTSSPYDNPSVTMTKNPDGTWSTTTQNPPHFGGALGIFQALPDKLKYIMYALAIGGGGLIMLVGFVLIAAGLGVGFGKTPVARVGRRIAPTPSGISEDDELLAAYLAGEKRGKIQSAKQQGYAQGKASGPSGQEMRSRRIRAKADKEYASGDIPF